MFIGSSHFARHVNGTLPRFKDTPSYFNWITRSATSALNNPLINKKPGVNLRKFYTKTLIQKHISARMLNLTALLNENTRQNQLSPFYAALKNSEKLSLSQLLPLLERLLKYENLNDLKNLTPKTEEEITVLEKALRSLDNNDEKCKKIFNKLRDLSEEAGKIIDRFRAELKAFP